MSSCVEREIVIVVDSDLSEDTQTNDGSENNSEKKGFQWIQSTNQEEFEIMQNVCYLEQFLDMNEDLSSEQLERLDLVQFIGLNNDESDSGDSSSSVVSIDDVEEGDNVLKDLPEILLAGSMGSNVESQNDIDGKEIVVISGQQSSQENAGNQKKNVKKRQNLSQSTQEELSQIHKEKHKKYQSSLSQLVQDQFIRYTKYGDLALPQDIARKNAKSDDFYNQDDSFIDDDQVDTELKQLAICEADYDDFYMVQGGLRDLVKCKEFKDRLKDIQEYRDTKKVEAHLKIDNSVEIRKSTRSQRTKEKGDKNQKNVRKSGEIFDEKRSNLLCDEREKEEKDIKKKKKLNANSQMQKVLYLEQHQLRQPTTGQTDIEIPNEGCVEDHQKVSFGGMQKKHNKKKNNQNVEILEEQKREKAPEKQELEQKEKQDLKENEPKSSSENKVSKRISLEKSKLEVKSDEIMNGTGMSQSSKDQQEKSASARCASSVEKKRFSADVIKISEKEKITEDAVSNIAEHDGALATIKLRKNKKYNKNNRQPSVEQKRLEMEEMKQTSKEQEEEKEIEIPRRSIRNSKHLLDVLADKNESKQITNISVDVPSSPVVKVKKIKIKRAQTSLPIVLSPNSNGKRTSNQIESKSMQETSQQKISGDQPNLVSTYSLKSNVKSLSEMNLDDKRDENIMVSGISTSPIGALNSSKRFLDEQPYSESEKKITRKIVRMKPKDLDQTQSISIENNKKSEKPSTEKEPIAEIPIDAVLPKKKIGKIEKRRRVDDIIEEVKILKGKGDKKTKR